jgi:N-acetylglucosaminyldiphosphoundecaprenol N-acetyl-beta-D-mannosaminyltransferase
LKILNINNVSVLSLEEIAAFCLDRLALKKGAFLIAMNPIKVIKARRHLDFQHIIDAADLVFTDAWGITWASRVLYGRSVPLAPGHKVMAALLRQAEEQDFSIYFLGTTSYILKYAVEKMNLTYPRLKIAGCHHGFFCEQEALLIIEEIKERKPDYVFVGMGEYKQEKIIHEFRKIYPDAIFLGVGGSIDLIAGKQPRPPGWVYRHHLEWLYRFFKQPFRARRFVSLPIFVFLIIFEKIKKIISDMS